MPPNVDSTNIMPCIHKNTETILLGDGGWWIELCIDCGRIVLHTPNAELEFFSRVTWYHGWRPDMDKKEVGHAPNRTKD